VPRLPDVLFVLAGTGDMIPSLQAKVEQLGLSDNFLFPGFLSGEEVEEIFSIADLYVMPSVSEPFGISALEAISFNVPVIISKQSGVSEVLDSALKVDFWDLQRMGEQIVDVLTRDDLKQELVSNARNEMQGLHWSVAAEKTMAVYAELLECVETPGTAGHG
jgi:glycosyltransferase involved in cell wall biosynthesis